VPADYDAAFRTQEAEVELPGAAAFLPQLAGRLVKKSVNDNFATLKQILEAARR
jgi:hypothetical protein